MKQNRRSIVLGLVTAIPLVRRIVRFSNMTAPPSNRGEFHMRKGLFTLLSPCLRRPDLGRAGGPANAADKIVIRFAHSNTPSDMDPYHALVTKMNDKLVKKPRRSHRDSGIPPTPGRSAARSAAFRTCRQGILQMTVLAVNNASISPSLGSVRPSLHLQERQGIRRLRRSELGFINKRMEAESGITAIAWHLQGFRFITNSCRCWPTSLRSRSVPPQQPDHDRRVSCLGHGPGSHGHGRGTFNASSRRS